MTKRSKRHNEEDDSNEDEEEDNDNEQNEIDPQQGESRGVVSSRNVSLDGTHRLKTIVKENHGSSIVWIGTLPREATIGIETTLDRPSIHDFAALVVASDQANVYESHHLDLVSHFVNGKTDYDVGGRISGGVCWIDAPISGGLETDAVYAFGSDGGTVSVVSLAQSRVVHLLRHDDDLHKQFSILSLVGISGTPCVAALYSNGTVVIWDTSSGTRVGQVIHVGKKATLLAYLSSRRELCVCQSDGRVALYTVSSPCIIESSLPRVVLDLAFRGSVADFIPLREDDVLIRTNPDGVVWNVRFPPRSDDVQKSVSKSRAFSGQSYTCIGASRDGRFACVGDANGRVLVSELESLNKNNNKSKPCELHMPRVRGSTTCASFGSTERVVIVGTSEGLVLKWERT